MPQINGPSEGIFILIAVFIIGYASDDYTHFYHRKLSFSFPLPFSSDHHYVSLEYCDIPLIGCTIFAILVIYTNIRNVIRHERMKKEEYDNNNNTTTTPPHHRNNNNGSVMMMTTRQEGYLKHYGGKRPRIRDALSCAFPFCLGGILSSLWVCWSYDNVMDKHPRLVIWMIGLIFSKLVTHIQVAHVCGEKYTAWRKTYLLPLIIIPINCGIGYYFGSADNATTSSFTGGAPPIDESSLLIFMTFTAAIGWINMAYGVLTEMVSTVKRDYCKDSRPSLTTIGGKKRKSVDGKDDISSIRHHHHYRGEVDEPPAATSTTAAKRTRIDLRQWLGIVSDSAAASAGEVAGAVVGSSGNDDGNTPRDRNRVAGENYDDTWVAGNDEVCSSCFEFDFNEGHTNAVKKTVYVRDLILPPPPRHNSTIKMHE
ncbi:CDP-alcohol phosphatidyltransferase [Perkinsus olseni]|nr:CDP-alcohol phosphatidyltransferase [Perkinsus olseni]